MGAGSPPLWGHRGLHRFATTEASAARPASHLGGGLRRFGTTKAPAAQRGLHRFGATEAPAALERVPLPLAGHQGMGKIGLRPGGGGGGHGCRLKEGGGG